MPFVSRFQEIGESEFIENLMALFDRDFKAALDWFNLDTPTHTTRYGVPNNVGATGQDLPDFAVKTDGDVDVFSYPLLVLGVERMSSLETDDGFYLNQDLRIGVGLVVKDTTLKAARTKARKYIRALKAVVRSASAVDLLPPTSQVLNHTIDIDHRYLRHGTTTDAGITQPIEFEIRIQFGET